ncbi:hypothetical protein [Roseococcus sp. YIM B11640]|uniref:hypothetical protein n=1 Tax=Roseococcus sp. YIM B11640 TaxID=3133973 RepID=UPI003C7DE663
MRHLLLAGLILAALPAAGQPAPGSDLCRLYPRDGEHAGCGICGGPGWRRPDGRCARWDDVGAPDCRALRRELADPARCARQRERGRELRP